MGMGTPERKQKVNPDKGERPVEQIGSPLRESRQAGASSKSKMNGSKQKNALQPGSPPASKPSAARTSEVTSSFTSSTLKKAQPKPMPNPLASNSSMPEAPLRQERKKEERTRDANAKPLQKYAPKPLPNPANKSIPNPFLSSGSASGFSANGSKFANSATLDADGEDTVLPTHLQASAGKMPIRSGIHRKPRFKQVVPPTKVGTSEDSVASQKSRLESLLDFASHAENEDEEAEGAELVVEGLVPRLLPHQQRGVRFMARREHGRRYVRGGLLADEMGLGKTIQSIGIILYERPEPKATVRTTLVVVPLAVADQWKEEILQMAPKLSVGLHHGQSRTAEAAKLHSHDVLITTYDIVWREHEKKGPLFARPWFRIIADEAHSFRNSKTNIAKAMAELRSDGRRWALTGTPLHNRIGDLYSLFKFIGVMGSGSSEDFVKNFERNLDSLAKVLRVIMLRRTQKVLGSFLPPIVKHAVKVRLSPREHAVYESWVYSSDEDDELKVVWLTRMRQACNGLLNEKGKVDPGWADTIPETKTDPALPDIDSLKLDSDGNAADALRTNEIDEADDLTAMLGLLSIEADAADEKRTFVGHNNSKVQEVRKILTKERTRQTVIFSSFVTMLHLLRPMLEFEGIKYLLYDGSLSASQRRTILANFRDDKTGYTVMLCSLQAAAVGLNLTSASQVIMVEPWWNPQIVDQAIKRVHRLGQRREVDCHELFAANILEERIMFIQENKRKLAKKLIDSDETTKLTKAERRFLYYGDSEDHDGEADRSKPATRKERLPWSSHRNLPTVPKHPKSGSTVTNP